LHCFCTGLQFVASTGERDIEALCSLSFSASHCFVLGCWLSSLEEETQKPWDLCAGAESSRDE
jgi:hypothetical protein